MPEDHLTPGCPLVKFMPVEVLILVEIFIQADRVVFAALIGRAFGRMQGWVIMGIADCIDVVSEVR